MPAKFNPKSGLSDEQREKNDRAFYESGRHTAKENVEAHRGAKEIRSKAEVLRETGKGRIDKLMKAEGYNKGGTVIGARAGGPKGAPVGKKGK